MSGDERDILKRFELNFICCSSSSSVFLFSSYFFGIHILCNEGISYSYFVFAKAVAIPEESGRVRG